MNNIIISTVILAFIGSIIRMVIEATGALHVSKFFSTVLGIVLIINIINFYIQKDSPKISYSQTEYNYEKINEETIEKIIPTVKENIKNEISKELKKEFNTTFTECNLEIDSETLNLLSADFFFDSKDILVSTYEIKAFLKEKFQITAEVYFI